MISDMEIFHRPPGIEIVYEDDRLLAVNKPAGLVCHPTKPDGFSSLVSRLRQYLGTGAELHLLNRLDRETSGLVLLAKDLNAARQLHRRWREHAVRKEYLALVHGHVSPADGTVDQPLGKDMESPLAIKDTVRPDGLPARTDYRCERHWVQPEGRFSLLRVWPLTGRKHQIRIHLAHVGHPVVGDKIYGGDEQCYLAFVAGRLTPEQKTRLVLPHHALHALALQFAWRNRWWRFVARPEPAFLNFLGGTAGPLTKSARSRVAQVS